MQDVDVECVAILNDTVGCLMSCAFLDHNTEIGVILGKCAVHCAFFRVDLFGSAQFALVVNMEKSAQDAALVVSLL